MRSRKQKWLAVALIAVLVITATTGAVYAYLSATTGPVHNTFTAAPTHTIDIKETFPTGATNPIKKNVCVDVGDPGYAVYVRAAIVVTWKKGNDVYAYKPVQKTEDAVGDYALELNLTDWFQGSDGFYYHKKMVAYDGEDEATKLTSVLIESCSQLKAGPEGYTLHVEIIAQTIQALGTTDDDSIPAVEDAWKAVTTDENGNLIQIP